MILSIAQTETARELGSLTLIDIRPSASFEQHLFLCYLWCPSHGLGISVFRVDLESNAIAHRQITKAKLCCMIAATWERDWGRRSSDACCTRGMGSIRAL